MSSIKRLLTDYPLRRGTIMFPNFQWPPQRGALAILSVALGCGLTLFTLRGYAHSTEAVGARVNASHFRRRVGEICECSPAQETELAFNGSL
jgi:hypothetical protein